MAWAAQTAGRMPLPQNRCVKHADRYAATSVAGKGPLCWECFLGVKTFKERFKEQAETFYKPGGPGWAGD